MGVESNTGKALLLSNDREGDAEISGPRTVLCDSVWYRPSRNTKHWTFVNLITWRLYEGESENIYHNFAAPVFLYEV